MSFAKLGWFSGLLMGCAEFLPRFVLHAHRQIEYRDELAGQ